MTGQLWVWLFKASLCWHKRIGSKRSFAANQFVASAKSPSSSRLEAAF